MPTRLRARFLVPLLALVIIGGSEPPSDTDQVRLHLRGAERILEGRSLGALSPEQRVNRARALALLGQYLAAGRFPQNEHFPGQRVPYFRDSHGVLCAMAYLLEHTGYGYIVERVARSRNNAFVRELADEPGLAGWLDEYGLTLAEAARIQPTYGPPPGKVEVPGKLTPGYAAASIVGLGLAGTGAVLNLTAPRSERRLAWLAAGAGFVTTMLGVSKLDNGGDVQRVAVANVAIGGLATLIGINGMFASRDGATTSAARPRSLDLGVTVGLGGPPGIAARFRF